MYTADDFNTKNAPKEMVQYIIDTVEGFDARYTRALDIIGRYRCPLQMADEGLYNEIYDAMCDWMQDKIEEIFG